MNFKKYLTESLKGSQLYNFYALEFILAIDADMFFEPGEKAEARNKFAKVMAEVWGEICADGIVTVIGEATHIIDATNFLDEIFVDWEMRKKFEEKYSTRPDDLTDGDVFTDVDKVLNDLGIKGEFAKSVREVAKDQDDTFPVDQFIEWFRISYIEQPDADPEILMRMIKLMFPESSGNETLRFAVNCNKITSPEEIGLSTYKKKTFDQVRKTVEKVFGMSVPKVLEKCRGYFAGDGFDYEYFWDSAYGGDNWAEIAETMKKFYEMGPYKIKMLQIDNVLDMVHNSGTWLNKFPHDNQLMAALDDKYEAETPEDFRSKINDRQIRKWFSKALRAYRSRL